jgi:hypothetical protein
MLFKIERHLWRTKDGRRLVPTGDVDAAFLAYARGDQIPEEQARREGLLPAKRGKGAAKAEPEDAADDPPAAPPTGSGVTITRQKGRSSG